MRTTQFPKNISMRRLDSEADRLSRTERGTQFRSGTASRSKRGFSASPFFAHFQSSVDFTTIRAHTTIHATYAKAGVLDVRIAGNINQLGNSVCHV